MPSRFALAIEALEAAVRRSASFRTWLRARRWCGEAVGVHSELAVRDLAILTETGTEVLAFLLALAKEGTSSLLVHLPLSVATSRFAPDAFELEVGPDRFYVLEAERRESYARFLMEGFRAPRKWPTRAGGALHFQGGPLGSFRGFEPTTAGDSSNLLLRIATSEVSLVFKSYKLLDPHNREPAILERLHRRRFPHAPRLLGQLSLGQGEERLVLGAATPRLDATDLFTWLVEGWREALAQGSTAPGSFEAQTTDLAVRLGEATADLHDALVDRKPGTFQAESFSPEDAQTAFRLATRNLSDSLRLLLRRDSGDLATQAESVSGFRTQLLDHRREIEDVLAFLAAGVGTVKSVTHGDLHLGQVLYSPNGDALTFIDFEGEPERAPALRSVKLPPLRDIATLTRSFAYVRQYVWRNHLAPAETGAARPPEPDDVLRENRQAYSRLCSWEATAGRALRERYLARTDLYPELDADLAQRLIRGWAMEKALYELRYELMHRPANFLIPLEGVLSMAEGAG